MSGRQSSLAFGTQVPSGFRGQLAPRLKVGERVRLHEGGPVLTVERVTMTAAYVRVEATRHVILRDDAGNVTREFDARESGSLAISPTSFCERVS